MNNMDSGFDSFQDLDDIKLSSLLLHLFYSVLFTLLEMDKGQESTSQAGNKEAMDILKAELPDEAADADPNQESETCTDSEGHLLAAGQSEKKHAEDDESGEEGAVMALRELNAKLEQNNEMLRKAIKERKAAISKVDAEIDALRKLKNRVLNIERSEVEEGLELDKIVEG
ncbi:hypothetical protein AVEN_142921-1, partial [Araneus ventricosus]